MTFTRTPTQIPVMEATASVELTETAAVSMQTVPGDLIPVGTLQTAAVETSHQEPTGAMRRNALIEKLRGLKQRSTAASAAARTTKAESARRAQFDRDWESFGSPSTEQEFPAAETLGFAEQIDLYKTQE